MSGRARAPRERLDALLVARGYAGDLSKARALIMAGKVVVAERRRDKPGERLPADALIAVKGSDGWASRGAHKLLGAIEAFPWLADRIRGARCLDIGASTGGFTDVLLRHGALAVAAVDVGYGQLVWRLQQDPRVTVLDRTNIRLLAPGTLPWRPSVATCDASFISLRLFLDVVFRELAPGGVFVALVKPQFEVDRDQVGEGGVVRDDAVRFAALERVRDAALGVGFRPLGHAESPLHGPDGNRELLLALERPA